MIDRQDIDIFHLAESMLANVRAFYYRDVEILNNLSKDLREFINTKVLRRRLINELICNMNWVR